MNWTRCRVTCPVPNRCDGSRARSERFVCGDAAWEVLVERSWDAFPTAARAQHLDLFLELVSSVGMAVGDGEEKGEGQGQAATRRDPMTVSLYLVVSALGTVTSRQIAQQTFTGPSWVLGFHDALQLPPASLDEDFTVDVALSIETSPLPQQRPEQSSSSSPSSLSSSLDSSSPGLGMLFSAVPESKGRQEAVEAQVPYLGLSNQGATCYLNSLLQALFHLKSFRRTVYSMPVAAHCGTGRSMVLELQRLFYQLQFSAQGSKALSTEALTRSFGWSNNEVFMQHDIQEMNRILCEKLDERTKGSRVEGAIQKLFRGVFLNYVHCLDVDFSSKREEDFFDLSLNVKGSRDIYQSFRQYIQEEMLVGDNLYSADHLGLQRARKGIIFLRFPPVLFVQLKRFEYEFATDTNLKINDKYVFYPELDLTPFLQRGPQNSSSSSSASSTSTSSSSSSSTRTPKTNPEAIYDLYAVLVHRGNVTGGHYIAFIKPSRTDAQWYRFDDGKVSRVAIEDAIDAQFGCSADAYNYYIDGQDRQVGAMGTCSNAYLLVYIQRTKLRDVMDETLPDELVSQLCSQFDDQASAPRQAPGLSEDLFMEIRIASSKTLLPNSVNALDILNFDPLPPGGFKADTPNYFSFRAMKTSCLADLFDDISARFEVPPEHQRFWRCHRCSTAAALRLDRALSSEELFEQISVISGQAAFLNLWLQEVHDPSQHEPDNVLLFCKLFTPSPPQLSFVGTLSIHPSATLVDLRHLCHHAFASSPDVDESDLFLYNEVSQTKIVPLEVCQISIDIAHIDSGDIIIISQRASPSAPPPHHSLLEWADFLHNRIAIALHPFPTHLPPGTHSPPSGPASIALELNRTMRLEDFIQHVATVLHAQGAAIALFQGQTDNPLLPALPLVSLLPRSHPTLRHIMGQSHYPMPTDLFYFVPPSSSGSSSTVGYHHTAVRTSAGVPLLFSHPQSACVADLTANLLHQSPATSVLRDRCKSYPANGLLCEIYFSKIVRYMDPQRLLSSIDARRMLYFIPSLLPVDCFPIAPARRIQFVHFEPLSSRQLASSVQAQALSLFGVPFFLDVLPDEELSSVIQRVLHYLEHYSGIPTLDYASWKWAVLSDSTDHSTIERYFSDQREGIDPTVEVIGLEHPDPSQVPTVAPAISIAP